MGQNILSRAKSNKTSYIWRCKKKKRQLQLLSRYMKMKTKFSFNCTFKLDSFSFELRIFRSSGEEGVVQVTGETYNLSALPQVRLRWTNPLNQGKEDRTVLFI